MMTMKVDRTNRPFRVRTDTHRHPVLAVPAGLSWMMDVYPGAGAVVDHLDVVQDEVGAHGSVVPGTIVPCLVPANRRRASESPWVWSSWLGWPVWMLQLDLPKLRQEDCETQRRIRQSETQWPEQQRLEAR